MLVTEKSKASLKVIHEMLQNIVDTESEHIKENREALNKISHSELVKYYFFQDNVLSALENISLCNTLGEISEEDFTKIVNETGTSTLELAMKIALEKLAK